MQDQTLTLPNPTPRTALSISLHPRQRWAFFSPATEILYGGAAGGGKSLLLRISAIRWCENIPGVQVYLFRRTFPDLRANHLRGPKNFFELLADKLLSGEVVYNKSDNEFTWVKTQSRIRLCHCQYEDDVINYQGAEIHVLLMDELTHFTDYQYRYLRGRCRAVGLNLKGRAKQLIPRIECGSNPGNEGHVWVKKAFLTGKEQFTIYRMNSLEGGMLRQFIPAKLEDNPSMMQDDPTYRDRLKGLGDPALVRAMEEGDWDIYAGQFFDEWRRDVHVLPWDWKPADHYKWFFGYDHGYSHPALFYALAVDEHSVAYAYKEVGCHRKHPDAIAATIRANLGEGLWAKVKNVQAGHDAFTAMKDGGPSIADQFLKVKDRIALSRAKIDRINGAAQVRSYLQWKDEISDAGRVVRLGPRLMVHPSCQYLIDCLPALQHDKHEPEDVLKVDATPTDPWSGDDPYDAVRYALMSQPKPPKLDPPFVPKTYEQRVGEWLDKKRMASSKRRNTPSDPILGNRW